MRGAHITGLDCSDIGAAAVLVSENGRAASFCGHTNRSSSTTCSTSAARRVATADGFCSHMVAAAEGGPEEESRRDFAAAEPNAASAVSASSSSSSESESLRRTMRFQTAAPSSPPFSAWPGALNLQHR